MTFPIVLLGDAVNDDGGILQTGPFGSQLKQAEYSDDGVPVIMPKDISNGEVNLTTVARVPESTAIRLSRHRIAPNGIVLPRRGEITKRAFVHEHQAGWLCGTGCLKVETTGRRIWPKYLYYHLGTPAVVEWLTKNAVGSTMLNLSAEIVSRLPIRLPAIDTQVHIARTLSVYDALIANNVQRIELLEESARLLYREWFVHFRFPGHEHVKIVNGVPEGWEILPVQSVCETYDDGDWLETKDQGGDEYRILQISNIGLNSFVETGNERFITAETFRRLNCHEVLPGDILVSRMPRPIGRGWLVTEMPFKMVTAVDVTIVRADSTKVCPFYLLHHINSEQNVRRCEGGATGSTRPRVSRRLMGSLPIFLPPLRLQERFSEIAQQNNEQKRNLEQKNEKLAQARDLLLPRLMSGEIAA